MEKIGKILKKLLYYTLIIIISSFTYKHVPIGAIAIFCATFASLNILAPILLLSVISLIFFDIISILVYIIFISIFIFETIYIKPLVAIENRQEKKKVNNYLFLTLSSILLIYLHMYSFWIALITLGIYKILVNGLSVIKNNTMVSFSREENISVIMMVILVLAYLVKMIAINYGVILNTIGSNNLLLIFGTIFTLIYMMNVYFSVKSKGTITLFTYINSLIFLKYFYDLFKLENKNILIFSTIVLTITVSFNYIFNKVYSRIKNKRNDTITIKNRIICRIANKLYYNILITLIYFMYYRAYSNTFNISNLNIFFVIAYLYNIHIINSFSNIKMHFDKIYLLSPYIDNRITNKKQEKFELINVNSKKMIEEFEKDINLDLDLKENVKRVYSDIIIEKDTITSLVKYLNTFTLKYFEIENIIDEKVLNKINEEIDGNLKIENNLESKKLKYKKINKLLIQYFNILEKKLKKQEKNDKIKEELKIEIINKKEQFLNLLNLEEQKNNKKETDKQKTDKQKKDKKENDIFIKLSKYIKDNNLEEEVSKQEKNIYYALGENSSFEENILLDETFKEISIYNQLVYSNKILFNLYIRYLKNIYSITLKDEKNSIDNSIEDTIHNDIDEENVSYEFEEKSTKYDKAKISVYDICELLMDHNIIVENTDKEIIEDVEKINKVFLEYFEKQEDSVKKEAELDVIIKSMIYNIVVITKKQEKVFQDSILNAKEIEKNTTKDKIKQNSTKSIHELIKKFK